MFGLENRGETLIFMSRHFDETITILISHFLRFGALKILTGDYFVLRINQIIYLPSYLAAAVTPDDWRPPSAHFLIVLLHADLFCALRLALM